MSPIKKSELIPETLMDKGENNIVSCSCVYKKTQILEFSRC